MDAHQDQLKQLELRTKEQELLKLELENREKQKSSKWRKFMDIAPLLSTVLTALITLCILYFSNFFDSQNRLSEARNLMLGYEKNKLDDSIALFRQQKDLIHKQLDSVQKLYQDSIDHASLEYQQQLTFLDSINTRTKLLLIQNISASLYDMQAGLPDDITPFRSIINLYRLAHNFPDLKGRVIDSLEHYYQKYKHAPLSQDTVTQETKNKITLFLLAKCIVGEDRRDFKLFVNLFSIDTVSRKDFDHADIFETFDYLGLSPNAYKPFEQFLINSTKNP